MKVSYNFEFFLICLQWKVKENISFEKFNQNSVYITSYVIHINKHKQIRNSFQKSTTTNEKKMKNKNNRKCLNLKGTTIFSQMI